MTKRKKQIEILGFTKASNLLPKDKKIDNKNTPLKTNISSEKSNTQNTTPTKHYEAHQNEMNDTSIQDATTDAQFEQEALKAMNDTDFLTLRLM
jgi:hypothetical protein